MRQKPYFTITLLLFFFLLEGVAMAESDINAGIKAYDEDDYETAFMKLSSINTNGDLKAEFYLGVMYYQSLGNDGNRERGESLIISSAEKGYAEAKVYLAHEYSNGSTKAISHETAFRYLQEAADEKHFHAMYLMGWIYYHGQGVEKNLEKAYELFEKSAYLGSIASFSPLAFMNYEGIGKETNLDEALMWSSMASELKDPDAMEIIDELSGRIDKGDQEEILDRAAKLLLEIVSKSN
jgi:uncharacterized protein